MPKLITMPKLSDTMSEGTLVKWHVAEGDAIEVGQEVADVETDKATMAMDAFEEGVLHKLLVAEGGKVTIGGAMAVLLEQGEEAPADLEAFLASALKAQDVSTEGSQAEGAGDEVVDEGGRERRAARAGRRADAPAGGLSGELADSNARVKASPIARKIAEARGLDLRYVAGTGPGGRIVRADVESAPATPWATAEPVQGRAVGAAPAPAIRPQAEEGDERIPLSGMRTIIAERLLASKTQIPHFYLTIDVDAAPLASLRKQLNAAHEAGLPGANKYTLNDLILRAVVAAATREQGVNAAFDGDAILRFQHVHLAVAVAVDDGLVTPVVRKAETKTLLELSREVKDLAVRARSKKLKPEEMQGGTITISNLGAYGIEAFDAIINPPQAAILSIGAARQVPVVESDGRIGVGSRMKVGMSCDHRVVDGAVGASYLAELKKLLESPALMLI